MRLYVICKNRGGRIYFQSDAKRRSDLTYSFELTCPHCGETATYSNYEVFAESSIGSTSGGAIVGGILGGLLFGPLGALGGAVLGGSAGATAENEDRAAAERFNKS